jgi:hypothetical protein
VRRDGTAALVCACLGCACFWLALGSLARAQAVTLPVEPRHLTLAGELGYFSTTEDSSSLHVLAPRISGQYAFDARYSLAADLGGIGLASSPDQGKGETVLRPGNPTVLGVMRGAWGRTEYRVGLGGAAPLARIDSAGQGRLQHAAFNYAAGLDGLWELWLWAPARAAVVSYGRLELALHPEIRLELAAAPALFIPVYEAFGRDHVDLFIPMLVGLGTKRGPVHLGLRLKAVLMPTSGFDALQLALEPWLRVMLGNGFLEARYTGNVDEPLAGVRGPRVWGLHLGGGGML